MSLREGGKIALKHKKVFVLILAFWPTKTCSIIGSKKCWFFFHLSLAFRKCCFQFCMKMMQVGAKYFFKPSSVFYSTLQAFVKGKNFCVQQKECEFHSTQYVTIFLCLFSNIIRYLPNNPVKVLTHLLKALDELIDAI